MKMKKIVLILLTIAILLGVLAYCQKQKTTVSDNAEEIVEELNKEETIEEAVDVILDVEADDYLFLVKSDKKLSLKTPKGDPIEIDGHIHFDKTGEYEVRVKYKDSAGTPRSVEKTIFVGTDAEIQDQKKKLEEENASENQESNSGANTGSNKPNTNTGSNNKPATNSGNTGNSGSGNTGNNGSNTKPKNCHYETRTETIPAWTENVLVKEAWTEQILVKEAWTETSNFCTAYGQDRYEVYVCNGCGYTAPAGSAEFREHKLQCQNSYHNDWVYYGETKCLSYETTYIDHPAEYKTVNHPAEYKTVEHPAETKTYQVEVCD